MGIFFPNNFFLEYKNMLYLQSVGTFIDIETKMTHPANSDGTPDLYWGMAVPLDNDDELDEEWLNSLSPDDAKTLRKTLQQAIEMDVDSCELCGGSGELHIYTDETHPDTMACWECIS